MKAKAVLEQISEDDLLEYERERELDEQEMRYAIMVHEAEGDDEISGEEFMKWWEKNGYH